MQVLFAMIGFIKRWGGNMQNIVYAENVEKVRNGKNIISNLTMHIKQGEIYGFLGSNGAGKTTVMQMITHLLKPTSGRIQLFGERSPANTFDTQKRMGSMIEYPIFYDHLTAKENLAIHCGYMGYYDKKSVDQALELTRLTQEKEKVVKHFSLGMKQRLGIARAICTKPELLVLDEPLNGLDPIGIQEQRELFRMLNREHGMTLFISSHILSEIEQLADTIGIIQNGTMKEEVEMSKIRARQSEYIELVVTDLSKTTFVLETKLSITNWKVWSGDRIRIYQDGVSPVDLAKMIIAHDIGLISMTKKEQSLEDYFMEMVHERDAYV
jgi:ABC-2 type transport system ATP-binding protein